MKRFLLSVVLATSLALTSCKFDDSDIWDKFGEMEESIRDHEQRISALEELCKQMNTNIEALQTLVDALEKRDYITNISPIREDGVIIGYTISFAYSDTITIYHGKDGKDGANGKDGYTPQIGVMKDTDGIYYWTLDGEWLLDGKGNKIKAVGTDGKDGQDGTNGSNGQDGTNGSNGSNGTDGKDGVDGTNGKDGVTPQLKIENDYWYVSYDNGATWVQLGKATGEDGKDGQDGNDGADGSDGADGEDGKDGDSIFKSVTQDDEYVYFNLADGTMITLPKHDKENIQFEDLQVKAICCKNWDTNNDGELSYAEAAAVETIGTAFEKNANIVAFTELKYFMGISSIPNSAFIDCSSLWKIVIPQGVTNIESSAFKNCTSLTTVIFETTIIEQISGGFKQTACYGAFANCTELRSITIPKSVQIIEPAAFLGCSKLNSVEFENGSMLKEIQGGYYTSSSYGAFTDCISLTSITIPASLEKIGTAAFLGCANLNTVEFESESKLTEIGGDWYNGETYGYDTHGAFQYCTSLSHISIPSNCRAIRYAAFYGCSNLSSVEFENKSKLESIQGAYYHYNSTGYIGAFANCSKLTSIVLPSNLNEIGTHAFYKCDKLSSIYCMAKIPPTILSNGWDFGRSPNSYTPFSNIDSNAKIYVPVDSYDAYITANHWSSYKSMIVGYSFE